MFDAYGFIADSSDAVFAVNTRKRIVLWNAAATSILGYSAAEVRGKICHEVLRMHDADGCKRCRDSCDFISAAANAELPPARETSLRTKSGERVWVNMSTVVFKSPRRAHSVLVHILNEVSRQHEVLSLVEDLVAAANDAETIRNYCDTANSGAEDPAAGLTDRETQVLRHLAAGESTEIIADHLCISTRTVRNHVGSILKKLGVHSRLEAVSYSLRNRIV
jgi:PAS domain S-box-containing protein